MPPKRSAASAAHPPSPAVEPSPVKTKFPTARIKRIMQADEEVGKVAQQTPIAVGKALEMFMVALVTKSADVAREKNSKRVSAQMLKHVVESDEQWDFLRDIVSKVENSEEKAGKGGPSKAKSQADSEDSEEEVVPEKKKRAGRKKKV
ncbi:putative dna polymerase [Cladorrhinum sp. PSN332]|nr:putative dna polymerase [Cladorrhinum sp. PSN332]